MREKDKKRIIAGYREPSDIYHLHILTPIPNTNMEELCKHTIGKYKHCVDELKEWITNDAEKEKCYKWSITLDGDPGELIMILEEGNDT